MTDYPLKTIAQLNPDEDGAAETDLLLVFSNGETRRLTVAQLITAIAASIPVPASVLAAMMPKAGGTFTGPITLAANSNLGALRMGQRASGFSELLEWLNAEGAVRGAFGHSNLNYAVLRVGGDSTNDAYRFMPDDLQMRVGGTYVSVLNQSMGLGGLRNKILNGDFRVNQRGAAAKAQAAGVYGYDRWKGHASGLEQVIEQTDVPAGTYTLSWSGGGTGRLNGGAAAASPITAALPGTGNVSVVVPATATKVQLEPGSKATVFEQRPIGLEEWLCQRYFCLTAGLISSQGFLTSGTFPAKMRGSPTLSFTPSSGTGGVIVLNPSQPTMGWYQTTPHSVTVSATIRAEAEL